jgi:hypothetical protein
VTYFAVAAGIELSASVMARAQTEEPCLFIVACDRQETEAVFRHTPLLAAPGISAGCAPRASSRPALAPALQAGRFEEEAERWDGLS